MYKNNLLFNNAAEVTLLVNSAIVHFQDKKKEAVLILLKD